MNSATNTWFDVPDSISFVANSNFGTPGKLWQFSNRSDLNNGTNAKYAQLNVNVFPNPAKDKLYVKYLATAKEQITITVCDINGKIIDQVYRHVFSGLSQIEIDLGN